MYVKGTEAQESLAAAEWQWPQRFSRSELIKVPFKALTLLYCPALSQVLRQNMPEHLHRRELCGEKSSSLATVTQVQLWTQLVQQTWVHSSNQCHQELLGQSRAHASKQGTVPWVPYGLQDSAWAKTTVNKNYSTDAKDVLMKCWYVGWGWALVIPTHMKIPHNAAQSSADTGAMCCRAATATRWQDSILLISNFVTGIHHLQLNCGTESSNTWIPAWGLWQRFQRRLALCHL